jgi:hypothetical protein
VNEEIALNLLMTGNKTTELSDLATLVRKFKCKWGKLLKKTILRSEGEL